MKRKFNLKKLIIAGVCLLFGFMLSGVFIWQTNKQNISQNQESLVVTNGDKFFNNDNSVLKLKWENEKSEKHNVKPMSVTSETGSASHSYNVENVPEIILGGTVVTITEDGENYRINFDANNDGKIEGDDEGYAILTITPGYRLDAIEMGNLVEIKGQVLAEDFSGFSITVEELDPEYSGVTDKDGVGNLVFKAVTSAITYNVDFFYRNNTKGYDGSCKESLTYSVEDAITSTEISELKANGTAVDWLFNATKAGVTITNYAIEIGTVVFAFDSSFESIVRGGNTYYKLIGVSGYGNFIAGDPQDATDPIIVASEANEYQFVIENNCSNFWSLAPTDKRAELYGVETESGVSDLTTSVTFNNITQNSTNKFMCGEGQSFNKQNDYALDSNFGYFVYNYGHYVRGYFVRYTTGNTTSYLTYSSGAWTPSDIGINSIANLENVTFGSLAEYLEKNVPDLSAYVTIMPYWSKATINVKNGSDTVGTVEYFDTYTLTPAASIVGQSFYCYKANNFIANSGTWNYIELTGYVHEDNDVYTLSVTPQYLSKVYKVAFNNTSADATIKSVGDYEVSTATTYTTSAYFYSNLPGLTQPTLTTTGLSDEISTNLATFYNGYIQSIIDNSPIYRKIFSGTSKYIYVIHNSEIGVLPSFVHDYQIEILWKAGDANRYRTAEYKSAFSAELEGKEKTKWLANYGQTLTPIYVYALDAYFEISDGTYSSKRAEWYGSRTPLETLPSLTTEEQALLPEDKSFSSWMVDGVVAAEQGYTISAGKDTSNKDVVVISKTGVELSFRYVSKSSYGDYYYGISYAIGSGVLTQNSEAPIVLAYYDRSYDLLIDNSQGIYWSDKDVSKEELYGAISSGENDEDLTTTGFKISSTSSVIYPFQTSINSEEKGVSFLKHAEMQTSKVNSILDASNYYYVYNYGHYIDGWEISYLNKWCVFNGSAWSFSDTKSVTAIADLSGVSFNDLVSVVKDRYPSETETIITIKPHWKETTINVKNNLTTVGTVTFAKDYTLTSPTSSVDGQEFFCYSANGELIANSADWNYTQINGYVYDSDSTYNLSVNPQYLNNIYKVTLKNTDIEASVKSGSDYSKYTGEETYNQSYYSYSDVDKIGGEKLDISGLTLGDEISLALSSFVADYQDFIISENSLINRKLFSGSTNFYIYLVHSGSVGILPTFENEYKMEILWLDGLTNPYQASEYNEDLYFEERNNKTIVDVWSYDCGIEFTPVCVYAIDLYFETVSGDYLNKKASWFGSKTTLPLPGLTSAEENLLPEGKSFSSWMVDTVMATAKGYTPTETGNVLTLTSDAVTISFEFAQKQDGYYYGISSVVGTGILIQESNPIVLAKLTREFNLTIDNSQNIYWSDKDVSKEEIYGAISSEENDSDNTKTSFIIADSVNSAYPFQTSNQKNEDEEDFGLAFYKRTDMSVAVVNSKIDDDNYYYVYNYGHHIKNWLIEITLVDSSTNKYVHYNGTAWIDVSADESNPESYYISTTNASKVNFQSLANFLDNQFMGEKGRIDIVITPIWEAVTINVISSDSAGIVTYTQDYTLTEPEDVPNGKTFFCYADSNGKFIANSATWNYLNIQGYEYANNSRYNLFVNTKCLDNVYKVTLSNTSVDVVIKNAGSYAESSDGNSYNEEEYNYSNIPGLSMPVIVATTDLSDNLSSELESFYNSYIPNIEDNSLIYRKVFSYETKYVYLINDSEVGILPTFEYDYQQEILWKDVAGNLYRAYAYSDDFREELNDKELSETWELNNGTLLTPGYVYRLDLYYEDADPSDGIYSTKNAAWFGVIKELEQPFNADEFTESVPDGNIFSGWMIDASVAKDVYGYNVVPNETNQTITISSTSENFSLIFKYGSIGELNENYYFNISSVQGYGAFTQSRLVDGNPQPIVFARFGRLYNLVINNTETYWNDKSIDDLELYGAYSSTGTNDGYAKTTMAIGNCEDYAYPFQTSEIVNAQGETITTSFSKRSDISTSALNSKLDDTYYYYVYSYGQYIEAWSISYKGVKLAYDGTSWTNDPLKTTNDSLVAILTDVSFQDLAAYLDELDPTETGRPTVTIKPIWKNVNIDVSNEETDLIPEGAGNATGTITYGSLYTLNTQSISQTLEKELVAFEYNKDDSSDSDLIAISSVWNYYNKNNSTTDISNKYVYLAGDVNGGGVYTLNVTPVFVDNIHRVNLTGIQKYGTNRYQVTDTDYEFFTRAGTYDVAGKNVLTFKDSFGSYNYVEFDNREFSFADEYVEELINCKTEYANGIKNGGLEVLRKVYYSSGTVDVDTTILNSTDSTFWIYLANGQQTGDLPVFNNGYNIHNFWQNIMHHDGSVCVGVDSCEIAQHYLYLAGPYNAEFHEEDIKSNKYLLHDEDSNYIPEKVWFLNDGHSGENVTLNAKYFTNYYYLEVQTLVDIALERRGYVRIDVVDKLFENGSTVTDRSGHYIVIAENNPANNKMEMKVYTVESEDKPINELTLTPYTDAIRICNGSEVVVTVKDQSQDPTAMATGEYDEMIGYKFNGNINQTVISEEVEDTTLFVSEGYTYRALFANLPYRATSTFRLDVYFEKIKYDLNFRIDNIKSGEFNVQNNKIYSGYKTSYNLTGMSVGNFYEVNYFAFAGYKLKNEAFMYNNTQSEKVLQIYDDATNISQVYTLTGNLNGENYLDGKWLRENFYSSHTTYPVDVQNLGVLTIQTEVVVFNYGVLIYDETDTTEQVVNNKGIVESFEDGQFSLTYSTGVGTINPVGNYLKNGNGFWYYDSLAGVDYAVLSSRMLIPQNPTTTNDNFYTTYKFLLTENPTTQSVLTSSNLAFMVQKYEEGKIIAAEDRNIFIMLEVRKIYTITMQVAFVENDTNDTVRTTTLINGDDNSKSIVIASGRKVDNGYYCVDDNEITPITSVTAYTYHGLNNVLNSAYNTNKYSEVRYYLNNAANNLETNEFVVDSNSNITIEYIPRTLEVEYIYMLNGVDVVESEMLDYITQTKPNVAEAGLKPGDIINYSLEVIDDDYDARVTINGSVMGATNKDSIKLDCSYAVSDLDLALNGIQIYVEVYPRSNARINIHYALLDTSKRDVDDSYGTFSVYVNETLKAQNTDSTPVDVIEGRNVYVVLDLNFGYHFVGIKKGTYSINQVQPDQNGRILLVENFDTNSDAGDYLIVIDKDSVTAILDTSEVKTKSFEAYINGKKAVSDLYVGAVVEFTYVDVNQERLDAFYCKYPTSTQDIENIDGNIRFKLTSEVLSKFASNTITFGVRTVSRYSLTMKVVGQEYLEEEVKITHIDGTAYENGTYSDKGTMLTFSVIPMGASEDRFKYDILFNDNSYDVINKEDIVITLLRDYSYTITITPKVYNVTVSENVYTDLTQLENGTPESVLTNQVNNMNIQGQTSYYSITTLEFTRVARKGDGSLDRELSNILIADNDSDKVIVIGFDGTSYTATVDGVEINLADYNYSISVNNRTIKLSYVTLNNISITLDYKDYKVISSG